MLYAGLYSLSVYYMFLKSTNLYIGVLPFPKKLVFRDGKKRVVDRQALLQFLVERRFVRIAIVLGCER
jgi:hypothetical protein